MEKRVCGLGDLPLDIIENILSYVCDGELVSLLPTAQIFQVAIVDLIRRGKKFKFSKCYSVNEAHLVAFLRDVHVQRRLAHLDFNHCYWMNFNIFAAAVTLHNLQELHVIDCCISSEVVVEILGLKLTSLTLSWSWNWLNNLKSTHQGISRYSSPLPPLFTSLRHLVIYVPGHAVGPGTARSDFLIDVSTTLLQYCNGLISLKMYEIAEGRSMSSYSTAHVRFPDSALLPCLESVIVDLPSEIEMVIKFGKKLFKRRLTPMLREVNFGNATLPALDEALKHRNRGNSGEPYTISSLVSTESITTVCFNTLTLNAQSFRWQSASLSTWQNSATPNCKVVSLNIWRSSQLLKMVASKCPKLESLSLRQNHVLMDNLVFDLTTIAQHCSQVTALTLTINFAMFHEGSPSLLKVVGEFHALRKLHLTTSCILNEATYEHAGARSLQEIVNLPNNETTLKEAMKSWQLYDLTQNCKEVEEFKLCPSSTDSVRLFPELMLACISNWKKLKHLYLLSIMSNEISDKKCCGYYISVITRSCRWLTTLDITDTFSEINYNTLSLALEFSESLKELCLHASLTWSKQMYDALRLCFNLERLYVNRISIQSADVSSFNESLLMLPKLNVIIIEPYSNTEDIAVHPDIEATLIRLQKHRPSFFYKWGKSSNYSCNNFPVIHKDLMCRSSCIGPYISSLTLLDHERQSK